MDVCRSLGHAENARAARAQAVSERCFYRARKIRDAKRRQRQARGFSGMGAGGNTPQEELLLRRKQEKEFAAELRADVSALMRAEFETHGAVVEPDELVALEEQLMHDILAEEASALMEIEAAEREREVEHYASQNQINHHVTDGFHVLREDQQQSPVLCPLCGVHDLHLTMSAFHCACGFRFDVRQDCATLPQLSARLASCFEAHACHALASTGQACGARPRFGSQNKFGTELLMAECVHCQFLSVVL